MTAESTIISTRLGSTVHKSQAFVEIVLITPPMKLSLWEKKLGSTSPSSEYIFSMIEYLKNDFGMEKDVIRIVGAIEQFDREAERN